MPIFLVFICFLSIDKNTTIRGSHSMLESEDPIKKRKELDELVIFVVQKAKCDGKSPVCSNCFANKEECIYSQPVKRRGLPTGYTHDLEKKVRLFQG